MKNFKRPLIKTNKNYQVKDHSNDENTWYTPKLFNEINCIDKGHSTIRYIIPLTQMIHEDPSFYKKNSLDLCIYINTLNIPFKNEKEIPIIDMRDKELIRCEKCNCFLNTYFEFYNDYKNYHCNICNYYGSILNNNIKNYLNELEYGSIEFIVNDKKFFFKNIDTKLVIVLLEESKLMVEKGALGRIILSLKSILEIENLDINLIFVSFSYDLTVYKYEDVSNTISENKVLDINNPNCFYNIDSLSLNTIGDKLKIIKTLEYIENKIYQLYSENNLQKLWKFDIIFNFLINYLEDIGARTLLFISDEKGFKTNIEYNDDKIIHNLILEKEKNIYENNIKLSKKIKDIGIIIDIFYFSFFNNDNIFIYEDLINKSDNNILIFEEYEDETKYEELYYNIFFYFTKNTGFDVYNKIRLSSNLDLLNYNFKDKKIFSNQFHLNSLSQNQIILADFKVLNMVKNNYLYFQFVTLYTNIWNQRIIRIHNLKLRVINNIALAYKTISTEIFLFKIIKEFLFKIRKSTLITERKNIINYLINFLIKYRDNSEFHYDLHELAIPNKLQTLPLYIYSFLLSDCFKKMSNHNIILKNLVFIKNLEIYTLILFLYPKIFKLNYYEILEGEEGTNYKNSVILPINLGLSKRIINKENIYILDNGIKITIYVLNSIKNDFITKLFNVNSFDEIEENIQLLELENNISQKINNIINCLRLKKHGIYQYLEIIKQNSMYEYLINEFFIEDKGIKEVNSYWKFLKFLHQKIKFKENLK